MEAKIEIRKRKFTIDFPEEWPQDKKDITLIKSLFRFIYSGGSFRKRAAHLLRFYGLRKKHLKHLTTDELSSITSCLYFLGEPPKLSFWVGPSFWFLRGFGDSFGNTVWKQLIWADTFSKRVKHEVESESEDIRKWLRWLFAACYTPKGFRFSKIFMEILFRCSSVISTEKLTWVWMAYRAQRVWLAEKYPNTHAGGGDAGPDFGPHGLIVDLAGPKFGDVDDVQNKSVHFIFTKVEKDIIQSKKQT